jgi:putative membrane protein insertion efficiency factor
MKRIAQEAERFAVSVVSVFFLAWHRLISPFLGEHCRFYPSCSLYAIEALEKHGIFKGSALGFWRLLRCNRFFAGGIDPVPERTSCCPARGAASAMIIGKK